MSNVGLKKQIGRIAFLLSSLSMVALSGLALRLSHAHPGNKHILFAAGYGAVILSVLWTRRLESRLIEAGLPRWTFWPYFLIVLTGCLGAIGLKFTNALGTLGLFLLLQLPALVFSGKPKLAEALPQGVNEENASASGAVKRKPARNVTPLGAIEFAIYVVLIAGLLNVLHLLRGDMAGLPVPHALKYAFDAGSALLAVLWIVCVRGRFRRLGLTYCYPGFCSIVLVACVLLFAIGMINFQHVLILFAVLQLPAVLLRREFIPASLVEAEASQEAGRDS